MPHGGGIAQTHNQQNRRARSLLVPVNFCPLVISKRHSSSSSRNQQQPRSESASAGARDQSAATFRISLPKLSPLNSFRKVSGKVSSPSTISSRDLIFPAAIQPAISRAAWA